MSINNLIAQGPQLVDPNQYFVGQQNALARQHAQMQMAMASQEMQDKQNSRNALRQYGPQLLQGDSDAISGYMSQTGDVQGAAQFMQLAKSLDADKRAKLREHAQTVASAIFPITRLPPEQRDAAMAQAKATLVAAGNDPNSIPDTYNEAWVQQHIADGLGIEKAVEFANKQDETTFKHDKLQSDEQYKKDQLALGNRKADIYAGAVGSANSARQEQLGIARERNKIYKESVDKRPTGATPTSILNANLKIDAQTESQLKPLNEAEQKLQVADGLASQDNAAADAQLHQTLVGLTGQIRATNMVYKDTAGFGSYADRLSNMVSKVFTGRYNDTDRKMIRQMIHDMQNNVMRPTRERIITTAKQRKQAYQLDPNTVIDSNPYVDTSVSPPPADEVGLPEGFTEDQ